MLRKPDYKHAMKTAYGLFEEFGIHSFPVSTFDIFKQLCIPCCTYSQVIMKAPQYTEFITYISKITDGFSYKTKDSENPYIVLYNDEAYEERIPFTLAHELGHILLRHHYIDPPVGFCLPCSASCKDYRDIEADCFAGALLRPAYLISLLHLNVDEVHDIFHVSRGCAETGIKIARTQFGVNPRKTHRDLTEYFNNQFPEFLGEMFNSKCGISYGGAFSSYLAL